MASSSYASTEETTNACRACRLLLGPCTDELRDVLRHYVPPSTFPHVIIHRKSNLPRLTAQQMNLILPRGSSYTGNYGDMDISLLYTLLRNICGIPPHSNGWGNNPDPTDRSLSANIERIRIARNQCVHSSSPVLSNNDFNTIWSTVRSAVMDIDSFLNNGKKFEREVDFLRHETMDPVRDRHYIEELRKQAEEDAEVREMVKGLKRKLEMSETERIENHNKMLKIVEEIKKLQHIIPPNIKDLHEIQLRQWREEDDVYSETHTFQEMLNKVRGQPYMTFVGVPGSGKSATIHHIALILQEEGYEIVPVIEISEIYRYCDSHNPQVFVIDNVVGVLGLQRQKLETLVDYEKIISDQSKRTKVLMSCREAVFNECYKSFFLNEENVIKMCSSENALNDDDKKAILQKHGLDKDLLSPTLLREASAMFPLLCKLYSKEEKFRNNVERFFTCPARYILEELDKMQKQNRLHYATLVLCLLNDNKLSNKILKDTGNKTFCDMKSKALEICKVKSYTDAFEFVDALSVMEGTYTKFCGTEYTFIHDSMFEIIAHHFGSQFPDVILQFMSSSYIANYVKLKKDEMLKLESENKQAKENIADNSGVKIENVACEGSKNGEKEALTAENSDSMESFDLCIRLGEDLYSMLAERLYIDIENMELYDVFMNDILKHPGVCHAFIEVLKTKTYTELKSLFLSEQKNVSKVVSKGKRVTSESESEKRDERSSGRRRERVLLNERGITETAYNVRVISWVVYYGHNQILQYILKQTELHKETQSELFSNSFNLALINPLKQGEKYIAENYPIENLWSFRDWDIDGSISEHQRLLLLSCYNGDLETVKTFIEYLKRNTIYMTFPDLDFKYVLGDKALEAASEYGHLKVVKELLEAGADVNPRGVHIPLTRTCEGGYINIVKELLGAGADVNVKRKHETPLIAACKGGHLNIVRELLAAGADVNLEGKYYTPLKAACRGGHINLVKELLQAGAYANSQGELNTPLTAAINCGKIIIIKELLKAGADVNSQGIFDTPLIAACEGEHESFVKELLDAGADVNLQSKLETPLISACYCGNMSIVMELLKAGADVNLQIKSCTSLIAACWGGHEDVVEEIVKAGADVNLHGYYYKPLRAGEGKVFIEEFHASYTPLTLVSGGGYMEGVKTLLKAGADVNPQDELITPLIAAIKGGCLNIIKELLSAGAGVNLQGKNHTPLTAACESGHMNIVMELLKAGTDVNLQGKLNTTLTAACKSGHTSVVIELLKAGADVNLQAEHDTPLTAACNEGYTSIVRELLKAGADVNLQGMYVTPMTAACYNGHINIVMELLKAGADINLQGERKTPLTVACKKGHMSIVKELLKAGADVNLESKYYTPLTEACKKGHMSIVMELLKAGADVNLQGKYDTPLILACNKGHTIIVKELLEAGADVDLQGECDTPLTAACKNGYMNIAKNLLDAGSDINMQDKEGNTPLYNAFVNINKAFFPVILRMFDIHSADSTIKNKEGLSTFYIALIKNEIGSVKQLLRTENESQLDRLRLHLFECLVNLRHSDVMTDSKDDVVMTRRRVWRMKRGGDFYEEIKEIDCRNLKHLLFVGLGVNQWIQLYDDSNEYDVRPLLFTLIDDMCHYDRLEEKVRILLEAGVDVNVRVWYEEYDSVLDSENDSDSVFDSEYDSNSVIDSMYVSDSVSDSDYDYDSVDDEYDYASVLEDSEYDYISVLDRKYDSELDREGVSVLERIRRLVCKFRKSKDEVKRGKVPYYKRVLNEVKNHVRRYSV